MNQQKWDAVAEEFSRPDFAPVNGWIEWNAQATCEAAMIRRALPDSVETLLEVGCAVGRLTLPLAFLFGHVTAIDTSRACRIVTAKRCERIKNVTVEPPALYPADAALVWNLYDDDWPPSAREYHLATLRKAYRYVLVGTPEAHWLHEPLD